MRALEIWKYEILVDGTLAEDALEENLVLGEEEVLRGTATFISFHGAGY